MGVFSSVTVAALAKVGLVVVSVGGLTAGAVFAYQTTQGESDGAAGQAEVTSSPTVIASSTQPAPPTPTSTALSPTQPPPPTTDAPHPPTPDTRTPIRDLPSADQVQIGKDGKYFIADRGDGCTWVEHSRQTIPVIGEEVVLHTDCPAEFAFTYRPASGDVSLLLP